jgi:hypothetical protein
LLNRHDQRLYWTDSQEMRQGWEMVWLWGLSPNWWVPCHSVLIFHLHHCSGPSEHGMVQFVDEIAWSFYRSTIQYHCLFHVGLTVNIHVLNLVRKFIVESSSPIEKLVFLSFQGGLHNIHTLHTEPSFLFSSSHIALKLLQFTFPSLFQRICSKHSFSIIWAQHNLGPNLSGGPKEMCLLPTHPFPIWQYYFFIKQI